MFCADFLPFSSYRQKITWYTSRTTILSKKFDRIYIVNLNDQISEIFLHISRFDQVLAAARRFRQIDDKPRDDIFLARKILTVLLCEW